MGAGPAAASERRTRYRIRRLPCHHPPGGRLAGPRRNHRSPAGPRHLYHRHIEAGSLAQGRDHAVPSRRGLPRHIINISESRTDAPLLPEDGKAAAHYVYMRRVHSRDARPYCVISIYLDEKIFRKSPKRFRNETVIPILKDMRDPAISSARQTLTIGTADLEAARLLQVPLNSPVAEVRRVFTTADRTVIYLGEVTYRGDFIRIDMDLRP